MPQKASYVSYDDLAIANAKVLVSDDFKNKTIQLTGPQVCNKQKENENAEPPDKLGG